MMHRIPNLVFKIFYFEKITSDDNTFMNCEGTQMLLQCQQGEKTNKANKTNVCHAPPEHSDLFIISP